MTENPGAQSGHCRQYKVMMGIRATLCRSTGYGFAMVKALSLFKAFKGLGMAGWATLYGYGGF